MSSRTRSAITSRTLLGILDKVDDMKQRVSQTQANALSVRVELQADCLAGVWANHANEKWKILQPGDIEKALATAQAIGDDRLQTAARGYAVPDSFTHGSSAQRQQWLTAGLEERRHQVLQHVLELTGASSPLGAFHGDAQSPMAAARSRLCCSTSYELFRSAALTRR